MFEKILVPVDGSDSAWIALEQAIEIAKEEQAAIHGLYVVDARLLEAPYILAMFPYDFYPEGDPRRLEQAMEVSKRLHQRGEEILQRLADRCQEAGVPCETELTDGIVAQVILERAKDADLVVLGRTGEGAQWTGPLLGSVFEAVVRHSPVPVLATHDQVRPIRCILVAYDGSERAKDALNIAARLAASGNRLLLYVTVDDGHRNRGEAYQEAKKILDELGVEHMRLFLKGHPAEKILEAAASQKCDLIVLGAYGHSPFMKVFFGSTVDEVIHQAELPVMVCH